MPRTNDNWERLVAAVLKREELWQLFHAHSRNPSVLSDASDFSFVSQFEDTSQVPESFDFQLVVFVSDSQPVFELERLPSASIQPLEKGTFGFSYLATLDHDGTTLMIRRLEMPVLNVSEQDFKKNMELVGSVRHENVAALRAYCNSENEKLMIYDHQNKESVFELLHGKIGENRAISHVPWKVRLRIAIGAARGIGHIHTQNGGKMVHGNIKASNIFLNSQRYGVVSDLGLANIETTFPQSSRCYAPEVKSSRNVSQASDVYSFGILLLQLLTQKSPEPFPGHEAVDLVKLVKSLGRKEWSAIVSDGDMSFSPNIREQVNRMLSIGLSCVVESPKQRPKMSAVVRIIEDIGKMSRDEVSVQTYSQRHEVVFLGDGFPTFDLKDLTLASIEFLGSGTSRISFKAMLEDGYLIYVKRLKDVIVTNANFHPHMALIGRMGHQNVADLKAYFYYRDEVFLVYNYYHEGSLSAMLHGTEGSDKRPLDWNTRLNIAVGAARGVAHIHTKDWMLVCGNIRASNIFLNEQQYGMISDVGLANLISPTSSSVARNKGYSAPEVTETTELSQASDVYSFGVVLLELLSGKPSQITYDGEAISLVRWTQTALREERTDQVFDPVILMHEDVRENMERIMQKAMHCVANVPEERPLMADVVKILEEIQELTFH